MPWYSLHRWLKMATVSFDSNLTFFAFYSASSEIFFKFWVSEGHIMVYWTPKHICFYKKPQRSLNVEFCILKKSKNQKKMQFFKFENYESWNMLSSFLLHTLTYTYRTTLKNQNYEINQVKNIMSLCKTHSCQWQVWLLTPTPRFARRFWAEHNVYRVSDSVGL